MPRIREIRLFLNRLDTPPARVRSYYWTSMVYEGLTAPGVTYASTVAARPAANAAGRTAVLSRRYTAAVNFSLIAQSFGEAPPAPPADFDLVGRVTARVRLVDLAPAIPTYRRINLSVQPNVYIDAATRTSRLEAPFGPWTIAYVLDPWTTMEARQRGEVAAPPPRRWPDYTLPFGDPLVEMSPTRGWIVGNGGWHMGFDFRKMFGRRITFPVLAIASGTVRMLIDVMRSGQSTRTKGVILEHNDAGRRALSLYLHLDLKQAHKLTFGG